MLGIPIFKINKVGWKPKDPEKKKNIAWKPLEFFHKRLIKLPWRKVLSKFQLLVLNLLTIEEIPFLALKLYTN
jgi:hypothetical protein